MAYTWVRIGNLKGPTGPSGDAAALGRFEQIEAALAKAETVAGANAKDAATLTAAKTHAEALFGQKAFSLDADGTPYWDPSSGTHRMFLDVDGAPYLSDLPWPTMTLDEDGVPVASEQLGPFLFEPKAHDHDGRYYTESEMDQKLASKAATGHSHTASDIAGLVDALADKAATTHLHKTSDVTGLTETLAAKANVTHLHKTSDITGLVEALSEPVQWNSIVGVAEGASTALAGVFDTAGAAAQAEAAAKAHASTLAYGSTLDATDATIAGLASDPATATGGKFASKANKGELVFNVLDSGADNTGTTASHSQINAAISAAATFGGMVYFPPGLYLLGGSILLRSKVSLGGTGTGSVTLKALPTLGTAILLGTAVNKASDMSIEDLTIDGNFSGTGLKIAGIQVSGGSKINISKIRVENVGGGGINLTGGTVDSMVERSVVIGTGLHSGDSHGIAIQNGSHRNKVRGNWVTGGRAMGIYVGTAGNGSTDCEITGNYTETIHTGGQDYECIGVTADCLRAIVSYNHCKDSHDNGISITPDECTVTGNIVEGCTNAGIAVAGDNCAILGNRIRNAGQDFPTTATLWGGIALNDASNCTVMGNVVYDDQAVPTMSYGVKEIGSANNNVILGNRMYGYRLAEFLRAGAGTVAFLGTRPTVSGSKGGNTALASLISALSTAGVINDSTTA